MRLPFHPRTITSRYGWRRHPITAQKSFHTGVDLAAHDGAPILPIAAGRVRSKRWHPANGNTITVDHGDGVVSKYMHLRRPSPLSQGDLVEEDTRLGQVGATGTAARGPHLHLEIWVDGGHVDPLGFLGDG